MNAPVRLNPYLTGNFAPVRSEDGFSIGSANAASAPMFGDMHGQRDAGPPTRFQPFRRIRELGRIRFPVRLSGAHYSQARIRDYHGRAVIRDGQCVGAKRPGVLGVPCPPAGAVPAGEAPDRGGCPLRRDLPSRLGPTQQSPQGPDSQLRRHRSIG